MFALNKNKFLFILTKWKSYILLSIAWILHFKMWFSTNFTVFLDKHITEAPAWHKINAMCPRKNLCVKERRKWPGWASWSSSPTSHYLSEANMITEFYSNLGGRLRAFLLIKAIGASVIKQRKKGYAIHL